ncbi:MAG: PhnD/SsuA/transferrin family substrate-binding protein [Pseudomonadota bacterium]
MIASLPMYDWPEICAWTDGLWRGLCERLLEAGFEAPPTLDRTRDSAAVWRDPSLLFSQTCGYPYAADLRGHVALLAAPHYDLEGCGPGTYSCAVVVSAESGCSSLSALSGRRFAFNSRGSLSGYRGLSPAVGDVERFCGELLESGSHRRSMDWVADGKADFALIDAVCWWLYQRHEPARAARLRVETWTQSFPALPFITSLARTEIQRALITKCLLAAIKDLGSGDVDGGLPLSGTFDVISADYAPLARL